MPEFGRDEWWSGRWIFRGLRRRTGELWKFLQERSLETGEVRGCGRIMCGPIGAGPVLVAEIIFPYRGSFIFRPVVGPPHEFEGMLVELQITRVREVVMEKRKE